MAPSRSAPCAAAPAYSVNGLRLEENHYLLDGISDNENHNGLGIILFPPLDAVEEFREETSVPDARFGRGGAGTVNLIFKSGTDQFHGDLFEFVRNSDFDARNFFDKNLPGFKMNQFGGTIGGPLGSRKSAKTFFFADYQGTRTRQGLTYVSTVPTALFRQGDFVAAPETIYDPLTQVALPGGGYSRSAFPGNTIPTNLIDPVGQNIIDLYPLPNLPGIATIFSTAPSAGFLKTNSTAEWIGLFRIRTTVSSATATRATTSSSRARCRRQPWAG